jgi:hypothetical protein
MMALKKKATVAVDGKHFSQKFAEVFGRPPTAEEFEKWCVAWGGVVEKDKCVFVYIETL